MKYRVPHPIPVAVCCVLIIGCFFLLATTIFSRNKESYDALVQHMRIFEESKEMEAKQERSFVQKEIWYNKNGCRLQVNMKGKSADVYFAKSVNSNEIMEHLTDVTAVVQEEVFFEGGLPMQKLKRIQAVSADYDYTSQELFARDVFMEEMTVGGDRIPETLPAPGRTVRADRVTVSFTDQKIQIQADALSGELSQR